MSKLAEIQQALKAPKNQKNSFGGYNYRSCEDILEAVKPLLGQETLTLSDDIVEVGGRVYVKATANCCGVSVTAFAREAENKKGMDDAQITGSASSYARKYALNGLFCIDDTKDADHTNDHGKSKPAAEPAKPAPKSSGLLEGKKRLMAYVASQRDGMFDGDMSNKDWIKRAAKLWLNKDSVDTEKELDSLENMVLNGTFDWANADMKGEI